MSDEGRVRHSQAQNAEVVSDDHEKAIQEAANSLRQAERVREYVLGALDGRPFKLRVSTILDLNRCAIEHLDSYAGNFRPAGIAIGASQHTPPGGHLVPELVEDMCDYVNDNWEAKSAVHLASFVMWRLNWIHPFTDGNGRTSRAVSYLILCVRQGMLLPGKETIPEQIVANRQPYYEALEDADAKHKNADGFPDDVVSKMEDLMGGMLAVQLKSAFEHATGQAE
ncbi:MAG: Fic family protein [Maritimibacter sp.]|uniref:Fic family protein n=1 Tax=Maritimibacter sp. TaxID=2003363 RepID=UPI001E08783A|nr:Fic family protein [Maritimibacter sp.]MBL6427855.1 Fic family protein [Maritimibacter sp.]